jgi:gliding motility-associated-like protein
MKKIILLLITSFLFAYDANSQITLKLSDAAVNVGATANVDVTISNFNAMAVMQFSINYDTTAWTFSSISNVTTALTDFDAESVATPLRGLRAGQLAVVWFRANAASIANNTRLFTINLVAKNQPCKESNITISGTPRSIIFQNASEMNVTQTNTPGLLKINGAACPGGGTTTNITFTAATVNAAPAAKVCVSITAKNFKDVTGISGSFKWNPAILTYLGIENDRFSKNSGLNEANTAIGIMSYLFSDTNPTTLPDDSKLFDICFTAKGASGTSSDITLTNDQVEWSASVAGVAGAVPTTRVNGKVNILANAKPSVKLKIANVTANEGAEVCVDFTVADFNRINGMEFNMDWDSTILQYQRVQSLNLSGLLTDQFRLVTGNELRLSWTSAGTTPITVPNDTRAFQVCFRVIGKCTEQKTSAIRLIKTILVLDNESPGNRASFEVTNGSAKVNTCSTTPTCTVVSTKNVSCAAGSDGGINVTVSQTAGCNCVWKKDGVVFQTNPATNCNLVNAPAGNYILELTCNGTVSCSLTQIITAPAVITTNGAVTNEACGTKGGIVLTVTGGSPSYTYAWAPGGATTKDITNLSAGSYTVTVTDSKSCTSTRSFTVAAVSGSDITINGAITNEACATKGSIVLTVTGGSPSYTYAWAPGGATTKDITNLNTGSYTVTVTDSKSCTSTRSFTVTSGGGTAVTVEGTVTNVQCFGQTSGAINLTVAGGCPDVTGAYRYTWSGPTAATGRNPTNLAAGSYSVIVMDNSNPTLSASRSFTITTPATALSATEVITQSAGTDGRVVLTIVGGTAPYKTTWTGPTAVAADATTGANLASGAYVVIIRDANNCTVTRNIIVPQASGTLSIATLEVTSNDRNNGFGVSCAGIKNAELAGTIAGGTGPYTIAYSGSGTGSRRIDTGNSFSFNQLASGPYSFIVTDSRGTTATKTISISEPPRVIVSAGSRSCASGSNADGAISPSYSGGIAPLTYRWSNGASTPLLSNVVKGLYNIVFEDKNGCQATASFRVDDCDAASKCYEAISIITPNNDGINDFFVINCINEFPASLQVYDRFGKSVYQSNRYDNSWNGTDLSGQLLREGSYMWVLEVNFQSQKEVFKGTVTLLRN